MTTTTPTTATVTRRPLLTVLRSAGNRHLFALTLAGAVGQHAGALMAAAAGGWVVGAAVEGRPAADLGPGGIVILVGFLAASGGQWLETHAAHAFAWRHQAALRLAVYDGVARSAPRPVLAMSTGEVASVAMSDIEQLEGHFAHLAPTGVAAVAVSLGTTAGLALVSPVFAAVFALGAVAVAVVPSVLAVRAAAQGEALRRGLGQLNATVVDGIRGMRELVLFRRVADWNERIETRTREHAALQARQAHADGTLRAVTDLLVSTTVVVTLVLAVSRAADGGISTATATASVVAAIAALRPIVAATGMAAGLAPLRASARRALAIIDQPDIVADTANGPVELGDASVTFTDVTFAYQPGRPVLDGVSFAAAPGEVVALVGPSGAGKTTCANLLLRFWDVDGGRIEIGGHDLRSLPVAQLRQLIGVVPQKVDLFSGTVADNLRIGAPDATDEEVEQAARIAQAHDFISALPDGYGTEVGEDGARLSGGQRQRLAIARAVLHGAPVLVLDEAASNLDTQNEQAVHRALRGASAGRTTIVIAHRISTIRAADRIVVLDGGRVVETGTHPELLAANGAYAQLIAHRHHGVVRDRSA